VGVDIGLRWLVIGKRRLVDAGLDFPLICACAEALPFLDQNFEVVFNESTLENLQDQEQALGECWRTLQPGGFLCLSTPNRFSLGPDPHTGIPAGGYLPEMWTAAIVRRQGGIPPRRKLLSAKTLSHMISRTGFNPPDISLPDIPEGQYIHFGRGIRMAVSIYHMIKRLPILRLLLHWIGPAYHAVAQKPKLNSTVDRLNNSIPGAASGS
jgi:SAM-dependent methyltransferase